MTASYNASGAVAYLDLGTTNNAPSITFDFQNETSGGPCVGTRWNHTKAEGFVATLSGSTLYLFRMAMPWVEAEQTSVSLTLTVGNTYTLSLSDDGSVVTAAITDDTGLKTTSITSSNLASNTTIAFGWMYSGATSVTATSTITLVTI